MESLKRVLEATRLEFEVNPAGIHYEGMTNPFGNEKPRKALKYVLKILRANIRSGVLLDLVRGCDLKDATNEVFMCQRNNQHAFKLVWYRHVAKKRSVASSVDVINNVEGRVWRALHSVLEAFRVDPFAVSPENTHRVDDLPTFAILIRNREAATRHELARQIGKAWVDDHVRGYDPRVRELAVLQTSLFELLWSGTVEQLKQHGPHFSRDPEQPEFERAVKELDNLLQEEIIRSKKQHFSIAFCGMVKAGKSQFLNALMGKSILPSDGESVNSRIPHPILSVTVELPSTVWPCRIRHVEGQAVPELQFQAEPFLSALEKLQAHQFGRKMQTYPSSAEIYDTPSNPSDEDILLRTIHRQCDDLHAVTRDNLLRFETPEFRLPPRAIGEHDVKILVSFVSC